jgi:uncharacterized protein
MTTYSKVIILLHGFNSAPGRKYEQIKSYLTDCNLNDKCELIAPKLNVNPKSAIQEINNLIITNKDKTVFLIGTSLGGFYANYFRAKFQGNFLYVHSINPSWTPSKSLRKYKNKELSNFKTHEAYLFKDSYLTQLEKFENFITSHLESPSKEHYSIHLSQSDEVLKFEIMLEFLNKKQIKFQKKEYESDHRFDKIKEVIKLLLL